jgi:hypothetical protein
MDLEIWLLVISIPVAFFVGVFVHKFIISEAESIKAHITAELDSMRAELMGEAEHVRTVFKEQAKKL